MRANMPTRRLDAGLYETLDGRARIESQERRLDGVHSDYGTAGWWLTTDDDDPVGPYDTKRDALNGYAEMLEEVALNSKRQRLVVQWGG